MKGHPDLLDLVGEIGLVGDLAEGTGSLLALRPDPAQVIPLRGEVLAWVDQLVGEAGRGPDHASEIGCLRGMARLLGGYIETQQQARPSPTVRAQVLSHLSGEERSFRPSDVADATAKSRSQVSTVLRSLAADGLVERDEEVPRSDGRVAFYRATRRGREVAAAERAQVEAVAAEG
jgi:DNA-binding MarR family transcriptional regulator